MSSPCRSRPSARIHVTSFRLYRDADARIHDATAHPCNLSEFVVSSGITADPRHMKVLFRGGLKNDNVNERFDLTRKDVSEDDNMVIPIKYVRIDSLATHAPNYNVTIW
jgi:hypothetical protein